MLIYDDTFYISCTKKNYLLKNKAVIFEQF